MSHALAELHTVQLPWTLLPEGSLGSDLAFLRTQEVGRGLGGGQQTLAHGFVNKL